MSYPTLFSNPGVKDFAEAVDDERSKQINKWGHQAHLDGTGGVLFGQVARMARDECQQAARDGSLTWRHIAEEEWAEAKAETEWPELRGELVQLASVLAAWILDGDQREARSASND